MKEMHTTIEASTALALCPLDLVHRMVIWSHPLKNVGYIKLAFKSGLHNHFCLVFGLVYQQLFKVDKSKKLFQTKEKVSNILR